MSRSSRQSKLERRLQVLEADFREKLIRCLKDAARGHWGMFGANKGLFADEFESCYGPTNRELTELGDAIVHLRQELGETAEFPLYSRFREFCSMTDSNALGEPKRAKQFLRELGLEDHV